MDIGLLTIHEVENETGISAYTIRYYDKCGFFKTIARTTQGRRRFSQSDVDRLLLIDALKKSGLSIDGLKTIAPKLDDPVYRQEIMTILDQRLSVLDIQMEDLSNCQKRIGKFLSDLAFQSRDESISTESGSSSGLEI